MSVDVFNNLQGLTNLNMSDNKIKIVEVRLFDALMNLEQVWFFGNTCISSNWNNLTFQSKRRLDMIEEIAIKCKPLTRNLLSQRQILTISTFCFCSGIRYLQLFLLKNVSNQPKLLVKKTKFFSPMF